MERYSNRRGNSPITHFQRGEEKIIVWFNNGKSYSYSYRSAGKHNVDQMKLLAQRGSGLSAYITKNVRFRYD